MKLQSLLTLATLPAAILAASVQCKTDACRCMPGDSCWPSANVWSNFNKTVGGHLIATVPIGSPCHDPHYDATACANLKANWNLPATHIESSHSVMQSVFANQSCDPFTTESRPCLLGNYVKYAVEVTSADEVAKTILFAKKYNIRFVIRNTGHDYFGRSTGAGALSVWMHNIKSAESIDYADKVYSGPAMKFGAGILGGAATTAAHDAGLSIVGGECPTVGVAGGYTAGGGHSALSTSFGLGADQTLEFEVVTADGKIVKASNKVNSDLYWALSGGGGGNYGVVTSMTVRAHRIGTVGGGLLVVTGVETETLYKVVAKFHELLPAMLDKKASVIYVLTKGVFYIKPITVANSTGDYVRDTVLAPFLSELTKLNVKPTVSYTTKDYYNHYDTYMGPLPWGHVNVSDFQYGSRLIPRSVLEDEEDNTAFNAVLRNLTENGVTFAGSAAKYEGYAGLDNAVLPQWRTTAIALQFGTGYDPTKWDKMAEDRRRITEEYVPQVEAVTPGSGTYMNEADFNQPNWEESFYGDHWMRLLSVKQQWDPESFFYTFKGVGSSVWSVANDGCMCKAKKN